MTPINLLDTPPSISAARVALLTLRAGVPRETALAPGQVTIEPDPAVLSVPRAAELLAAIPPPVRYQKPEVRHGVLIVQCEHMSEPRERDLQELAHAMSRRTRFGFGQDLSERALARIKVLLEGRDEQLLVTGEAFDRWVATYQGPHTCAGGPAYDGWALAAGLGDAVRASRPDYVYRFSGSLNAARITVSRVEDIKADSELDAHTLQCARCGKPASKILRRRADRETTEPLCTDCAVNVFPRPRALPSWPDDPAAITPEMMIQLLSNLTPEQLVQGRESIKQWLQWTDSIFPAGVIAPPDVVAIRAMIRIFGEVLGLG